MQINATHSVVKSTYRSIRKNVKTQDSAKFAFPLFPVDSWHVFKEEVQKKCFLFSIYERLRKIGREYAS